MRLRIVALSSLLCALLPAIGHARPIAEIHQARIDAAARVHARALVEYENGKGTIDGVYQWSIRWMSAEHAHAASAELRAAATVRHRERMDLLAARVAKLVATGFASATDSHAAAYYCAEAELWVSVPG